MPIAVTEEQRAIQDAVRAVAARVDPHRSVREHVPHCTRELIDLGVLGMAVSAEFGGAGGSVSDLAAALEQSAYELFGGPLLTSALAGLLLAESGTPEAKELLPGVVDGTVSVAVALCPDGVVVRPDGTLAGEIAVAAAEQLIVGVDDRWWVVPTAGRAEPVEAFDFSRPLVRVRLDGIRPDVALSGLTAARVADVAVTLGAAEAAGIARWCLDTAVAYAKVREQFGKPIGAFQAVKHLCAQMLCRSERAAAVAWDAARSDDPVAAAVAGAITLDAAVDNAKDCVQVLGGIGFTWEHDAHLYLRRASALRSLLGGSARWRQRAATLVVGGARRRLGIDVGVDADVRDEVRRIAALPVEEQRAALVDTGYLVPHWPEPFGLGASARTQLVIDAELAAAGVRRPDLVIGAWAVPTILRHGTDEQRERFAWPTLRGELAWCQLFSEPEAGSDLAALRTRATKVDGGWSLSGQKVWTSRALEADWGICLARTNPDVAKHKGITYFLVDMTAPGITLRPLREITGESMFNEVFLDGVLVPDDCVVGSVDGGWALARSTLADERVAMGGSSAVGESVEKLVSALGSVTDPVVLDRLGGLVADGTAVSLVDLRATLRTLDGQGPGSESGVRKLIGVRHRQAVAEAAVELLWADGAVADERTGQALHEFLLSRCLTIAGGTEQILLSVAGERVLGLPR
ncbi:acyl-CoA dehydrogenase [Actinokineospora xionganensis]|uniref:Acyl-CoA dehydrogenase n=1 Tax=Actinokineospora xionganensis TaxID=2684470 RepID=A0ABR7L7B8_9PSEU|nr:acyl-CoA dehydrogenase [Actinokineospora xionganensis]MBC6448294.1 acyl-CoA dehydrogenase [Actinokineospora xionganensis]